jgi:hypothetical protein
MGYAADHAFDFVCISAQGAGTIDKLFGSTTTNLINQSSVPVIAVPVTYRTTKLTSVLYASDLSALETQLQNVVDFVRPLTASVKLLHFIDFSEPVIDPEIVTMAVRKFTDYPINVQLKPRELAITLVADIESAVKAEKPSLIIMFTQQNDGFFQRLFSSSNSIDFSFLTTVPLLVFRKV